MTRYRAQIMEHDGISSDHFFEECLDAFREHLLAYFKARQTKAVEGGKYRAAIKNLSAFDLEVLISALEKEEPATYIGGVERSMRQEDERP